MNGRWQQLTGALLLIGCTACGGSSGDDDAASSALIDKALLENYVDHVVVPTYAALAARAGELTTAIAALQGAPDAATLTASRSAWVATRAPWEQSEGFLFGPVDTNGYDPAIDSWPLNRTDLDLVLASGASLDASYVGSLDDNQKGFHTVEFLLYGEDSDKQPGDFTEREFAYLLGSTQALQQVAENLVASWTAGVDGGTPFRDTFVTAGEDGNTVYPSLAAAGEEIVKGLQLICDEVADGKIATPFDVRDPNLVESQFSFNSLQDFSDNLRSVANVWNGHAPGETPRAGASLSERVAGRDAALDARVKAEMQAAIDAILAVPAPFPKSIQDAANDAAIKDAQVKVRTLSQTLLNDVLPLTGS